MMRSIAFLLVVTLLLVSTHARALPFGINKVRYHTGEQWRIIETEHFDLYYHPKIETLAQATARFAEDAFLKVSQAFDYVPQKKIPLFLYGTGIEFQETNITPAFLPEGVGGFTEAYKNRIVVPSNGSYYDLEMVITHELVHAFQYNLIYGEGWRSFTLFKSIFVPTWMMEGLAEWIAGHWESQGDMVLRDAVLHDKLIPLGLLNTFEHFEQVYMAYKESQSILEYVAQVYGREKVTLMMKKMASSQKPDAVVKSVIGITPNELYRNWLFYVKSHAWSRVQGRPDPVRYGDSILPGVTRSAVSPDGKKVAFLTENGELGLYDPKSKKRSRLRKGTVFNTQGSGIAWSPDGTRLAYALRQKGFYRLAVMDVASHRQKTYASPALPVVYSPEWSPDGKALVFTGYDYARADLYRLDLATQSLTPLTQSEQTESWARFTNDGSFLYFIQEWDGKTRIHRLKMRADGRTEGEPEPLGDGQGHISSLVVSSDRLYFTCDRSDRIFNLYRSDLEARQVVRLTDTYTDVLSASTAGDETDLYSVVFEKFGTSLYRFASTNLENRSDPPVQLDYLSNTFKDAGRLLAHASVDATPELDQDDVPPEAASKSTLSGPAHPMTPAATEPKPAKPEQVRSLTVSEASNIVQLKWTIVEGSPEQIERYRIYRSTGPGGGFKYLGSTLTGRRDRYVDYTVQSGVVYSYYVTAVNPAGEGPASDVVEARPSFTLATRDYRFRFSPDLLLFLAGYDSSFGFAGGGVAVLSDYLGDHRLALLGDAVPNYRSGIQIDYEYSAWRTTVGLNAYYFKNFYRLYDLSTGNVVDEFRDNERGADLVFTYPFNTSTRFEYGVGTQRFVGSPSFLRFSEGISSRFDQEVEQEEIANYYRIALVRDRRKGHRFMPVGGYAWNGTFLHSPPVMDANVYFRNIMTELQWYKSFGFLGGLTWANRWVGLRSFGANTQEFFLGEDTLFQTFFTTMRGYGNSTYYGSHLGLWNLELRYPVAEAVDFPLRPFTFILLKDVELAFFTDTGIVADHWGDLTNRRLLNSVGGGIRLYNFLFQRALVQLRFDLAWRTDRSGPPVFHFNLAPIF